MQPEEDELKGVKQHCVMADEEGEEGEGRRKAAGPLLEKASRVGRGALILGLLVAGTGDTLVLK